MPDKLQYRVHIAGDIGRSNGRRGRRHTEKSIFHLKDLLSGLIFVCFIKL